ncbi:unnamed protein product [Thlaspi arvense]|uniref:Uncharacterized protein n=1 Tax=Thlaspi arvense TaxID=13288 RepID=A0AAU9S826_THLAR|nr:unnamed protein product [Thlaspi arvense]
MEFMIFTCDLTVVHLRSKPGASIFTRARAIWMSRDITTKDNSHISKIWKYHIMEIFHCWILLLAVFFLPLSLILFLWRLIFYRKLAKAPDDLSTVASSSSVESHRLYINRLHIIPSENTFDCVKTLLVVLYAKIGKNVIIVNKGASFFLHFFSLCSLTDVQEAYRPEEGFYTRSEITVIIEKASIRDGTVI